MFNPTLLTKCQCCGGKADSIIILDRYPDQLMQICTNCVQNRKNDFKVVASMFCNNAFEALCRNRSPVKPKRLLLRDE